MTGLQQRRLLIIGAGMATAQLLQELVARGHDYRIDVIGDEAVLPYNRVLLSSLLAGERQLADLELHSADWYQRHHISLHCGERVQQVDLQQRSVSTVSGRSLQWDLLVFATGSRPAVPKLKGLRGSAVMAFRSQADLAEIRQAAAQRRHAVVLGGGLLGLEAAHGLRQLGLDVTVVHRQQQLLNRQLDEAGAQLLQQQLQAQGLQFALGQAPARLLRKRGVLQAIELEDGSRLPCKLLLLATGIVPNAELAQDAGLDCGLGIRVDAGMQTSQPQVYALGECCQHESRTYGLLAPVQAQAAVLAARLCGDTQALYRHRDSAVQLKIAGIHVVSGGEFPFPADSSSQVLSDVQRGVYRRLAFRDGRLCSFVLVGDQRLARHYQQLLEQGIDLQDLRSGLMFRAAEPSPESLSGVSS
jgi:nitrite reductase (NADH) large subunit